jgi:hypothetical protein
LSIGTSSAVIQDATLATPLSTLSKKRLLAYASLTSGMSNASVCRLLGPRALRIGLRLDVDSFDPGPVPRLVRFGYGMFYTRLARLLVFLQPFTPPLLQ